MLRIQKSQTADRELFVRVLSDKTEMKEIFSQFDEIGIFHTVEEFESETEEFHFIGMNI